MKPCVLIRGLDSNIEEFENQLALAFEQGYELSGELITHVVNKKNEESVIVLLQPMFLPDEGYNEEDNF